MANQARARAHLADGPPPDIAVAMIATAGLKDFVLNTTGSMLACGVLPSQVFLFHSDAAAAEYAPMAGYLPSENILPIGTTLDLAGMDPNRSYSDYGTADFKTFMIVKWFAIRWLLSRGFPQVVFTDVDIAWIRNPLAYLRRIAKSHDLAIQNEAIRLGRAEVCNGFMSLKNTSRIDELLSAVIDLQRSGITEGLHLDDQWAMNTYLETHREMYKRTWVLPEAQFPNGLFAPMFSAPENLHAFPLSQLRPMIFHANWCIGLEAKQERLTKAGLWRPGGWPVSKKHRRPGT